jgi:hypothetical protein
MIASRSALAQPVAFGSPVAQAPAPLPTTPSSSSGPASVSKASSPDKSAGPDTKQKVEAGLTAAAIAAIIIQASRDQYHAGGKALRLALIEWRANVRAYGIQT